MLKFRSSVSFFPDVLILGHFRLLYFQHATWKLFRSPKICLKESLSKIAAPNPFTKTLCSCQTSVEEQDWKQFFSLVDLKLNYVSSEINREIRDDSRASILLLFVLYSGCCRGVRGTSICSGPVLSGNKSLSFTLLLFFTLSPSLPPTLVLQPFPP